MTRSLATKLLLILAMLLSIASGPVVAFGSTRAACASNVSAPPTCAGMPCCGVDRSQPAPEKPAPVQQRVGQDIASAVTSTTFSLLYLCAPTVAKRAPMASFTVRHAPAPLALGCIQLI